VKRYDGHLAIAVRSRETPSHILAWARISSPIIRDDYLIVRRVWLVKIGCYRPIVLRFRRRQSRNRERNSLDPTINHAGFSDGSLELADDHATAPALGSTAGNHQAIARTHGASKANIYQACGLEPRPLCQ
jgi:hypothetical protein